MLINERKWEYSEGLAELTECETKCFIENSLETFAKDVVCLHCVLSFLRSGIPVLRKWILMMRNLIFEIENKYAWLINNLVILHLFSS